MTRAILIGGSGFLGSALAEILAARGAHQLVVLDVAPPSSSGCRFIRQDIRKPLSFVFAREDVVIHLAANQYHLKVPRRHRSLFFSDTNTQGTRNVLARMLDISSTEEELGWIPAHNDTDMMLAAFAHYRECQEAVRNRQ